MTMERTQLVLKYNQEKLGNLTEVEEVDKKIHCLALECTLRNNVKGTIGTRRGQIVVAYLASKTKEITEEISKKIVEEGEEMALQINEEKSKKIMIFGGRTDSRSIKIVWKQ